MCYDITVVGSFGRRLTLRCRPSTPKRRPQRRSTSESQPSWLGRSTPQYRPSTHWGRPWLPQCNQRSTPRRLRRRIGVDQSFIGVCVYVYIHTHTHTNTHLHTHNPHTYTYTHTHNTHTYTHINTHKHTYTHTQIHTHIQHHTIHTQYTLHTQTYIHSNLTLITI